MEDCNQLGNAAKMNEILDPNPKSEDNNNSVFEHLMHHYFNSQNLVSNPPSLAADCVPLEATLLEQLAQDAADLQEAVVGGGHSGVMGERSAAEWATL